MRIVSAPRCGALVAIMLAACAGSTPPPATAAVEPEPQPTAAPAPVTPAAPSEQAATTPAAPAPAITPVAPAQAPQAVPLEVPSPIALIVHAEDRTDDDRALDPGRHPGETLTFFGITPGMRVAEIFAGGGYTAELLARTVGPQGKVYGQNTKFVLQRFAEAPWTERLKRPVMKNVVRVDRELDDPLPPEATNLDVVVSNMVYHDSVWLGADRDAMNAAIFRALKPGGIYAVIDHSGRAGTGTSEAESLHRIEEASLRAEIERAGFQLAEAAFFLRNPQDTRDWNASPRAAADKRGTSDRFVLKFVKPSAVQ